MTGIGFFKVPVPMTKLMTPSWPECGKWCKGVEKCKFWTYHISSKTCFAKESDAGKKRGAGFISGPETCPASSTPGKNLCRLWNFNLESFCLLFRVNLPTHQ